jgi:hypothetical protein
MNTDETKRDAEPTPASDGSVSMTIESMGSRMLIDLVRNGSLEAMSEALKRLHCMDKVSPMRKDWEWFCISPNGLGLFPFPNEREAAAYSRGTGMRLARVVPAKPANGLLGLLAAWLRALRRKAQAALFR